MFILLDLGVGHTECAELKYISHCSQSTKGTVSDKMILRNIPTPALARPVKATTPTGRHFHQRHQPGGYTLITIDINTQGQ
jgi:hypothetical protein